MPGRPVNNNKKNLPRLTKASLNKHKTHIKIQNTVKPPLSELRNASKNFSWGPEAPCTKT